MVTAGYTNRLVKKIVPSAPTVMALSVSEPLIIRLDCRALLQYVSGAQALSTAVFFSVTERLNFPAKR